MASASTELSRYEIESYAPNQESANRFQDKHDQQQQHTNEACSSSEQDAGRRILKGHVLFLRIGKKISNVKSRGKTVLQQAFVYRPFGSKPNSGDPHDGLIVSEPTGNNNDQINPFSPSSSEASVSSSVLSHGTGTKRYLGAVPVYGGGTCGMPYGAINYSRSEDNSTIQGSDAIPPPPVDVPLPQPRNVSENLEEDAVSYLAAAMNPGLYLDALVPVTSNEDIVDTTLSKTVINESSTLSEEPVVTSKEEIVQDSQNEIESPEDASNGIASSTMGPDSETPLETLAIGSSINGVTL